MSWAGISPSSSPSTISETGILSYPILSYPILSFPPLPGLLLLLLLLLLWPKWIEWISLSLSFLANRIAYDVTIEDKGFPADTFELIEGSFTGHVAQVPRLFSLLFPLFIFAMVLGPHPLSLLFFLSFFCSLVNVAARMPRSPLSSFLSGLAITRTSPPP